MEARQLQQNYRQISLIGPGAMMAEQIRPHVGFDPGAHVMAPTSVDVDRHRQQKYSHLQFGQQYRRYKQPQQNQQKKATKTLKQLKIADIHNLLVLNLGL